MKPKTFLILFLVLFLIDCKPPSYGNPCDPDSGAFKNNYIIKTIIRDKSAYCGLVTSTVGAASLGLTLSYVGSPYDFYQGTPITTITPTINGIIMNCISTPSLPTGLTLSTTDCSISGIPLTSQTSTNYAITAANSTQSGSATISIQVKTKQAKFLLVTNAATNNVAVFSINSTTGVLSGVAGSPFLTTGGTGPRFISAHPNGLYVYTANQSSANINGFSINSSTGALTALSGSPFSGQAVGAHAIAIDPTGKFLYASSFTTAAIFLYSIASSNGTLTYVGSYATSQSNPAGLVVDPTGKFLFTGTTPNPGKIEGFAINSSTGALTSISGSPYTSGNDTISVAIDPLGKFVYGVNYFSNDIYVYSINSTDGTLTPISGSPFALGSSSSTFMMVEPTGKFLYVGAGGTDVVGFKVNSSTGFLTSMGAPFSVTPGSSPGVVYADPSSTFLYSANTGSANVSGFTINQTTGALTQIGAPSASGGTSPFGLGFVSY